jgi:hypothetical protein
MDQALLAGGWGTVAAVAATVAVLAALASKAVVALWNRNRSNAPPVGNIVSPIAYCRSKCAANMRSTVCILFLFAVLVIAPFASLI